MPQSVPRPGPAAPPAPSGGSEGERLLVLSVGKRPEFHAVVLLALADAGLGAGLASGVAAPPRGPAYPREAYGETVRRARRFLDRALPPDEVHHLRADTLSAAPAALEAAAPGVLALLLVDAESAGVDTGPLDDGLPGELRALSAHLPESVTAEFSAYTVQVYESASPAGADARGVPVSGEVDRSGELVRLGSPFGTRRLPGEPWLLAADVVRALADAVQARHTVAAARARAPRRRALARGLTDFLTARAGIRWGLHYYTGSQVTGIIGELEETALAHGNPVLRGPSEQSLAAGALARWQLDEAPFLIVVTNGMVDEFRGTLANLREARARGFVVCAEADPHAWFPFQGTVHQGEDSRAVLRARGLRSRFLDDPERLPEQLAAAQADFDADEGPVFLLATAPVLNAALPEPPTAEPLTADPPTAEPPTADPSTTEPPTAELAGQRPESGRYGRPERGLAGSPERGSAGCAVVTESALEPVLRLLNEDPRRILWQCGQLDAEERELVLGIAGEGGIGLADSLARPGTVSRYHAGRPVEEYLGTLGMMGCSARVHAFLHRAGRPRPAREQSLFFVKSRIADLATPFSESALRRSLHVVQVTDTAAHLAPFTDLPVHAEARGFLRAVRDGLAVRPEVREARRAALAETRDSASDLLHRLPLRPMSPNHFFHRLAEVLDDLITTTGYRYTGLYDVGRGAISAVRNLPRTGPGYSGWYGRALMGDALQAVPAVALTREDHVLAFVGDGASSLVPDILPTLVQQSALYGARPRGNLSVFRLVDGGHSVIRTYRETQGGVAADRQTRVPYLLDPDWSRSYGPLPVSHRVLEDVPAGELRERLQQRGAVHLYSVLLAHNNEGDGLSPDGELGWQRDELPELAFTAARALRRAATRAAPPHRPG
ncbi:hypothetical protein E0L36_19790 [Streptomyces sp. AJS327]|uniref:hypothetical protein n=1 Tax=Streptomyces sp. AJS327 TaxID=2545265 RepID=UPI0015DF0E39|nr:hypothetical protein [Streptomyces sp. AJS327]MBA0053034.1 hypothetical protein [Streptomyces sp. AJS327]